MIKECAVCKQPAVVVAKVYKDGRSIVVPLCRPCMMRISQKKQVEVVDMQSSTSEDKSGSRRIQQEQISKKLSKQKSKNIFSIIAFTFVLLVAVVGSICFFVPVFRNAILLKNDTINSGEDTVLETASNVTTSIPIEMTPEQIFEYASKATVEITATGKDFVSTGTGFFCNNENYIITNYHVIEDTQAAYITAYDGGKYDVVGVCGFSQELDIALLETSYVPTTYLNSCQNTINTGEAVYTIGSSEGLTSSFSSGIVSNASRFIDGYEYIQITAPISNGNSGGPALNNKGEVIGINSASITSGQNINLVIPIDIVTNVIKTDLVTLDTLFPVKYYEDAYETLELFVVTHGTYTDWDNMSVPDEYIDMVNQMENYYGYDISETTFISAYEKYISIGGIIDGVSVDVYLKQQETVEISAIVQYRDGIWLTASNTVHISDLSLDSMNALTYNITSQDHLEIDASTQFNVDIIVNKRLFKLLESFGEFLADINFPYTPAQFGFKT